MATNATLRGCVKDPKEAERGQATWWNKPIIPFIPEEKTEETGKDSIIEVMIRVNMNLTTVACKS